MFTEFMNKLSEAFPGNTIYIPDVLQPFLEKWLSRQADVAAGKTAVFGQPSFVNKMKSIGVSGGGGDSYKWNGKDVVFFQEEKLVTAFRLAPLPHEPEKLIEPPFVIEFSLMPDGTVAETADRQPTGQKEQWGGPAGKKVDDDISKLRRRRW